MHCNTVAVLVSSEILATPVDDAHGLLGKAFKVVASEDESLVVRDLSSSGVFEVDPLAANRQLLPH